MKCETCMFFESMNNGIDGKCHRFPHDLLYGHPMTSVRDWCGEYKERKEEKTTKTKKKDTKNE